ncbi:hypothetical protein [Halosimplex carlsbadense]|uniref:hypothetical protein n=1 Tax=Halosimplex carlsbadense TaxID=171164 RepID=UPI001268C82A|nr:hypothetical protein [Halosimplex carlsbadense]
MADDARAAGVAFGTLGAVVSSLWAVSKVLTVPNPDQQLYATVIVAATVLTALVGAVGWSQVVTRFDRWPIPVRGAIAGALTIWAALTLLIPVVVLIDQRSALSLSRTIILEALGLALLTGTVGMVFIGIFFLPFGALTGYLLGRRQTDDPGPIPVVARFR